MPPGVLLGSILSCTPSLVGGARTAIFLGQRGRCCEWRANEPARPACAGILIWLEEFHSGRRIDRDFYEEDNATALACHEKWPQDRFTLRPWTLEESYNSGWDHSISGADLSR